MKLWKQTLLGLIAASQLSFVQAKPVELDKVAVIVNSGVVLQSDIETSLKTIRANAKKNNQSLPDEATLREQVTEKLIVDTIQQQEAERIGVRIDDNRLNEAIDEIARNNNQTLEQLNTSITEEGLSYAQFREQVRKEIAANEARNALVRRRINILPAEVDNLANILAKETNATVQYKIGHIQLRVNDGDDKAAIEEKANQIVKELNQGSDFSTMAYTYSKGPKLYKAAIGDGCAKKKCQPSLLIKSIYKIKAVLSVHFAAA